VQGSQLEGASFGDKTKSCYQAATKSCYQPTSDGAWGCLGRIRSIPCVLALIRPFRQPQMLAEVLLQTTFNQGVVGSSPTRLTKNYENF
jgi:hypothetical protein